MIWHSAAMGDHGAMAAIVECPTCARRNRVPIAARGKPRCGSCKESLPWLVDAGDDDFAEAVDATVPVLVDMWAPWCGPCRVVAPVLEDLATERAGRLKVVKVNVDEAPAVAQQFRVRGVPALLLFEGGELVDRQVGAMPAEALVQWLDAGKRRGRG